MYSDTDTRPPLVFISHSSADNAFAKALITMLADIGIDKKGIVCTSEDGFGIKVGKDWPLELKNHFINYRVYVIIVHSSSLYESPVSMNEMGAAWVLECPIYSFLVNGFFESMMAGVLPSSHQGVLVGKKDIKADLDQLKEEVSSLFGIQPITEEQWSEIRHRFIKTVEGLPPDRGIVKKPFDVNTFERIHLDSSSVFNPQTSSLEKEVSWIEILKSVAPVLRVPHSQSGVIEAIKNSFPGIVDEDVIMIIDKLRGNGLASVTVSNTEFEGVSEAWSFTEAGFDAYGRSMNYHMLPVFQERDKAQVIELMNCFSTSVMDEYLQEGPDYVSDIILTSYEGWRSIIEASSFQIFNDSLRDVLERFYRPYFEILGHGECYDQMNNGLKKYKLSRPKHGIVDPVYEAKVQRLDDLFPIVTKAYYEFINYIKAHYPELDLKQSSREFEQEFG